MTSCDHRYITEAVEGAGGNAVEMMVASLNSVRIRIGLSEILIEIIGEINS